MRTSEKLLILVGMIVIMFFTVSCYGEGGKQFMEQKISKGAATNWKYRLPIEVDTGEYERYHKPVETHINFTEHLNRLGVDEAFDKKSIRIVEVDSSDNVLDDSVVYQFDEVPDYDAASNASGTLIFVLDGTTPVDTRRKFYVYFDDITGSGKSLDFTPQVSVKDIGEYEGDDCFKITTRNASYYYHKHGLRFSKSSIPNTFAALFTLSSISLRGSLRSFKPNARFLYTDMCGYNA